MEPNHPSVVLEARNLCKHFRPGMRDEVRAVDDVSLSIVVGSFVLLTGPSGSGKSTLLALLGALERPTRGQVFFEGRDLSQCSDSELARVRRRFGFVFQSFSLIAGLPVWENITYPLIPRGVGRAQRLKTAKEILTALNLPEKWCAMPDELSGGEQQRVAVARALAGQPAVLLADEPTSNLDPTAAASLVQLFGECHRQGTTVVLSSHDLRIMPSTAVVHQLRAGKLAATTTQQPCSETSVL